MPRVEKQNAFFRLRQIGSTLKIHQGTLGADDDAVTTRRYKDRRLARKAYEEQLTEWIEAGYRLVDAEDCPFALTLAACDLGDFLQPLLEAPYDAEALAVYGDWLQGQGDPRGELTALQLARHQQPENAEALRAEEVAFIDAHAEALLGRAAPYRWRRFTLDWHGGFIRRATLGVTPGDVAFRRDFAVPELLAVFLQLPATRLLESLRVGVFEGAGNDNYRPLIRALATAPQPSLLRQLELGYPHLDYDYSESGWKARGELRWLSGLPGLKQLSVRLGQASIGAPLELPRLEELTLLVRGHTLQGLCSSADLPRLERLTLVLRPRGRGRRLDTDALAPLSLQRFGSLTKLAVRNLEDQQVGGLFTDGGLEQLEILDLSYGYLQRAGELTGWAPVLRKIPRVMLSGNLLTQGTGRLASLIPGVELGQQRPSGTTPETSLRGMSPSPPFYPSDDWYSFPLLPTSPLFSSI